MSNLISFQFKTSNIRIELKNNEPLFCLTDVTSVLEIKNAHTSRFNLSSKGIHKMYTLTKGGKQELLFIDESNLYRVIFRSNKKEAVDFQNWVFEEVLPSIRKTGSYSTTPSYIISPDQLIQIRKAIAYNHERTQNSFEEICASLRKFLNIKDYETMPVEHFTAAIKFLERDLGFTYQPPILRKVYVSELNLSTLLNQMVKVTSIVNDEFKATGGSRRSPFYPLYNHFHNLSLAVSLLKCELENQKC